MGHRLINFINGVDTRKETSKLAEDKFPEELINDTDTTGNISNEDWDWWCHLSDTMKYILIHDLPYQEEEIGITEFYDENDLDTEADIYDRETFGILLGEYVTGLYLLDDTFIEPVLDNINIPNNVYSTNIFAIHYVAKHILGIKDLDKRLKSGDIELVRELGEVTIGGKEKYFYSFATKYCSHHNPIAFPIYDSCVEQVLLYFNKVDKFSAFKRKDLKNYRKFKEVLIDFQRFNLKELDLYLWLLGKEIFPKSKN